MFYSIVCYTNTLYKYTNTLTYYIQYINPGSSNHFYERKFSFTNLLKKYLLLVNLLKIAIEKLIKLQNLGERFSAKILSLYSPILNFKVKNIFSLHSIHYKGKTINPRNHKSQSKNSF